MSRIITCPIPENINPLSPNGYMFSIAKLPSLTYFCQEVNLPTVSLGSSQQSTPLVPISLPGDIMEFEPLNIQFLIDSRMNNYTALFNWMNGLGFPLSYAQHLEYLNNSSDVLDSTKMFSDGTLHIYGNTGDSLKSVKFSDVYPVSLESLVFTSRSQDVQYLVGSATFRYTHYTIE
jgi:hypothetical protein